MANVPTLKVKVKGSKREVTINASDFDAQKHEKIQGEQPAVNQAAGTGAPLELNPPRVSESGVLQALEDPIGHDPSRSPEPDDRIRLREATPDPLLPAANPPTAGVSAVRTDPSREAAPAGGLVTSTGTGPKPGGPTNAPAGSNAPARQASTPTGPGNQQQGNQGGATGQGAQGQAPATDKPVIEGGDPAKK